MYYKLKFSSCGFYSREATIKGRLLIPVLRYFFFRSKENGLSFFVIAFITLIDFALVASVKKTTKFPNYQINKKILVNIIIYIVFFKSEK